MYTKWFKSYKHFPGLTGCSVKLRPSNKTVKHANGLTKVKQSLIKTYYIEQNSNATRKWPDFYTTNCCRAVYSVGKIAQLILKNLWRTSNRTKVPTIVLTQ